MRGIGIRVTADVRGEITDVTLGRRRIRIVHTLPRCHRGGYVFSDTEKKATIIEGENTFYFTNPATPGKEEIHQVFLGDKITIPKGIAYREFTEKGTWFAGFIKGDNKGRNFDPYRKLVKESLNY